MSQPETSPAAEIERLEGRVRRLAEEKSYLQLVMSLIEKLDPLPGVHNMVENMLHNIVETIGGTNIKVWYWIGNDLHHADFLNGAVLATAIDDPVALQVLNQHEFVEFPGELHDALLRGDVLPGVWTWAFPLLVGETLVGIVKLENIHIPGSSLRKFLPVFFSHLALILSNEIRNFQRQQALAELHEKSEELRQHQLHLEQLVGERTAALQTTHQQLLDTQFAMDRAGIGIHWVDADSGRLLYVNRFAAEILGYSVEEMLQLRMPDIDTAFVTDDFRASTETFRQQGLTQFETTQRTKDGRLIPAAVSLYYLVGTEGRSGRFIAFITDITLRKEAEQALVKAKDDAEAANIAKSAFLANMSHEIRTPLNAITGMAHLIRRSGVTFQQAERLAKIDAAGKHLLDIINAILDLSKIEAGKLSLEHVEVHLGSIVGNVASILSEPAQAKHLKLIIESLALPHGLFGDPTRLQQALLNYAANAIKFTETGSVTLRASVEEEADDSALIRFEVIDTGIGIEPEAAARLFASFEQADNSTTRKFGGTGLGLAITRKLAELMGGSTGVQSKPGVGSTFWFTARLKKAKHFEPCQFIQAAADSAEETLLLEYSGSRVLLAEDEPINREVTVELLKDVGLAVDIACDGKEAVEQATRKRYDLILMDMQMPRLDGLDATRQIRRLPHGSETPILAMTANAFVEDKARCFEAGMNDFIGKPVAPEALFATILKWLARNNPHATE